MTPKQIGLLLSLVNIRLFTQVRPLALLKVDELHLRVFLQHASRYSLICLIVPSRLYLHSFRKWVRVMVRFSKTIPSYLRCIVFRLKGFHSQFHYHLNFYTSTDKQRASLRLTGPTTERSKIAFQCEFNLVQPLNWNK